MKTQIFSRIIAFFFIVFGSLYSYSKNIYVNDVKTSLDIYCTVAGSALNDGLSPATPKAKLSQAIGIASAGDIIYVDAGNYNDSKIILSKDNISIIGAGSSITVFNQPSSGTLNYFMRIFNRNNITFKNLQIGKYSNNSSFEGEAITIDGSSNVLFENVALAQNRTSVGEASVVINNNSTVTFEGLTFSCQGFQSGFNGGGIDIKSSTDKYSKNVTLNINNSLISGNDRTSGGAVGGGMIISGDNTVFVNITNSTFYNNKAQSGGGIYIEGGVLNVSNTLFESNIAVGSGGNNSYGGAIQFVGTSSTTKSTLKNCKFLSNQSTRIGFNFGGAISFSGGRVIATDAGSSSHAPNLVDIVDCEFINNATLSGKGNDIHSKEKKLNTIFISNTSFSSGATSVYNESGSLILVGCNNPNPTTFGAVTMDLTTRNTTTSVTTPTMSGNCPSVFVCNPAKASASDAGCDWKSTLTATGPAGSIFYWYKKLSEATTHATNTTKLWEDTSSTADPKYDLIDIKSDSVFYVVSNLDGCLTPTPVTIKYTCAPCPSPVLTFPSKACPKTEVRYATTKLQSDYAWTIPGVLGVDYEIVSGGTATSDTLIIKWLTKGDKVVRVAYKDNTGCTATSINTNITTVSDLSTGAFTIQPSPNSCQNTPIKYASNNTNTNFKWLIDNNTGTAGIDYEIVAGGKTTDDTLIIIWKTLGNHKVELDYTASGGCATTTPASYTTKVVANPAAPTFANSDVKQPICTDPTGSVKFSALPAGNWTIISVPASTNSPVNANGATYTFTGLVKNTSYKFVVKDSNACSSDSTSVVTMNDVPNQPEITGVSSLCKDSTLTLRAWVKGKVNQTQSTPNAANPWFSSDLLVATATKTVANSADALVVGKSGGSVKITYTDDANCKQEVTIQIAPKAQSGVASIDKDTICKTTSAVVSLAGYTTTASIQWQDSTAGVWGDIPTEKLPTMNTPTALAAGDYFYRAVVKNGFCNQYDTSNVVKLVVIGLPVPTFVDTIQPTCTVATGGVTSYMQYPGVWTIKAIADPLSTGATKDITAKVINPPFTLTIDGLKPGKYTFQVSNSKGCLSNASASIVINPQPTIPAKPVLDGSVIYCASNPYTLDKIVFNPKPNPSASESIKYFDKNGVVITNPSLVTVKPNEKYKFVFNNGSCDSKDTLTDKIPMDKGPTLASNGTNLSLTAICAVEKPTFNTLFAKLPSIDTSLYSFYITPDTLIKPINYLPNKTIIGSKGGNLQEFYYTFADKVNGCKNTVFAKLSFKLDEGPKNLSLNGTQTYCGFSNPKIVNLDKAVISKSNNNNTLVWYATNTSEVPLNDTVKLSAGTYYGAEKENPGCESVDRKQVVVIIENFGQTNVNPNNVYAFCKGSNKKVSDLPITPYSTTNFVWLDSYKKQISNPSTTDLIQGTYYAAEFKNGCISDQSQAIDVKFESPIISISPSKLPTCGVGNGAFKIVGAEQTFTYVWQKNSVLMPDNGDQISNLPSDYTIKYSVIVKDLKGCMAYDTASFSDCEPPGIPHVITLNKDGKNDVFKLHYDTKYPKCKLSIFNRWGAMVYESKEIPYKDDWDGKPNVAGTLGSGELPTGTYFYLIDKGDGSALESGYVELVK